MGADAIALSVVSHAQNWLVNQLLVDLAQFHPADLSIVVTQNVPDPDRLAARHGAEVIVNERPRGFGANHNAAFRRCDAPYFCVVNPDIRLNMDPFPALVQALQSERAEWKDLDPAYADAIGYVLTALAGYLRERPVADFVLIVLGDHQPPAGVAGEQPSWDVPVHVIASRRAIVDELVASGFTNGVDPQRTPIGRTHALTPLLLRAFGSDAQFGVNVAGSGAGGERPQPGANRVGL